MMVFFVTTEPAGEITGLYTDAPGHAPVPAGASAITDADAALLFRGFSRHKLTPAGVVYNAALDLEDARSDKITEINAAYASAMDVIAASYPETERDSWAKQETQARAYVANNAAAVPLLSALATARGLPLLDVASRVIAKADAYELVAGQNIGRRQARMDAIAAAVSANDLVALQAVVW
jgi:hypothetical protein